jgi:hypothetical protein
MEHGRNGYRNGADIWQRVIAHRGCTYIGTDVRLTWKISNFSPGRLSGRKHSAAMFCFP